MHPNNVSRDIVVDLQQGSCTLPMDPTSTYYKGYGFRDWAITDDEIMYGIFTTYRYLYSSSAPAGLGQRKGLHGHSGTHAC